MQPIVLTRRATAIPESDNIEATLTALVANALLAVAKRRAQSDTVLQPSWARE